MEVHGARAEEQLCCCVPIAQSLPHEGRYLTLLRGQRVGRGRFAPAGRLPGGAQLLGCPLGPGVGAEFLEKRERRTQVRPCLDPVTGAPQMLTKGKFGTGTVEKPWR